MTSKDRLLEFLNHLQIGQGKFESNVGLANGYLNNNKGSIGTNQIAKIVSRYPVLNINWLVTGEGTMLNTPKPNTKLLSNFPYMSVPVIHIPAQAGYSRGYGDEEYIESMPTYPVILPADKSYKGKYRIFEIQGDSMDDGSRNSICDGDKILCREVIQSHWDTKLFFSNYLFVIVMRNDGIFAKQIINHHVDERIITCHSLNIMYDDFDVVLNDVAELYSVVRLIDRNIRI